MKKIQDFPASAPDDRDPPIVYHGGDLAAARRAFPDAPAPFIDLSTGINPQPYPIPRLAPEVFAHLPDGEDVRRLEQAAARRYRAEGHAHVVAAPGTQALIQLLPQLHRGKRVGILGFTYGEYAQVWRRAGLRVETLNDLDALARCDIAVVVNPNNPDGRILPAEALPRLAEAMARRGGFLIVDEAFIDLEPPTASLVPLLPQEGALVLRSFGKTYGLAGLRLGFAITTAALAARLRGLLGPWAVSGPAVAIGRAALEDDRWLENLPRRLARQSLFVETIFRRLGAERIGGTTLFHLFAHRDAEGLFEAFGREGILLRRFPEKPDWLRVGLVAEAFTERLETAAERIRGL